MVQSLNQKRNELILAIREADLRERRFKVSDRSDAIAKVEKERERKRVLSEALNLINQGSNIDTLQAKQLASLSAKRQYDIIRGKLKQQEVLKGSGLVATRIKIGGKTLVGYKDSRGNFIPTPASAKDYNTIKQATGRSKVSELKAIAGASELQTLASARKELETQEAREQIIKKVKSEQKLTSEQKKEVNKFLGGFSVALTPEQKARVYGSFFQTTLAENEIRRKVLAIDKRKDLNSLEKEILKRKIVGIKPSEPIPQSFINLVRKQREERNKELSKLITPSEEIKLERKALYGETLTPSEQKKYIILQASKGKKVTKQQLTMLKNVPKDVATGLYEVAKEVVTLSKGAVVGAYNYGFRTSQKANAEGKNVLELFGKDINRLSKGTIEIAKFIIENPVLVASLVGVASSQAGKSYKTAYLNNPVKTVTKTLVYLFPSTTIKAGASVIKAGSKLVGKTYLSVTQAKRFNSLSKYVNIAKQGSLTASQVKKLDKALLTASKIGSKKTREAKIRLAFRGILKERGLKIKRGSSLTQLAKQIKASKVQKIKIIGEVKKPKVKVIKKEKPILLKNLKGAKVEVGRVAKVKKIKNGRKVITRYKINKDGSLTKITKKQFDKLQKIAKKPIGRPKKIIKPTKKIKEIDITSLEKKQLAKELSEKGIVKRGKEIYIDVNAVERLEKSNAPIKIIKKSKWGKKGQARFNTQIQIQVQKQVKAVKKTKKAIKTLSQAKKVPKAKLSKLKKELVRIKKELTRLLRFVNRFKSVIIRSAGLIKIISLGLKEVRALERLPITSPKPKTKPLTKPKTKPLTKPKTKPATKPATDKTPKFDRVTKPKTKTTSKTTQKLKQIKKTIKPRPTKKPPKKPKKLPKLKLKLESKKKATTQKGAIIYTPTGKKKPVTIRTGLPINRAKKVAREGLDNSILGSVSIKGYGKTNLKDIKDRPSSKNRRKRSKKTRVQNIVEKSKYRLDTQGEKKGITFAKAVKSAIKKEKSKLKQAPKKTKKTVKKIIKSKTIKKVKKVSKKTVKKKMSSATKKKISLALKKAYKKKLKKSIKKR